MSAKLSTPLAKTWKRRLGRWRQSGLSAAVFSKQERVSEPRLYVWRKRFADAGQVAKATGSKAPVSTFVPVQVQPTLASIELVLNSGQRLRLPINTSPDRLAEILKAAAPC